MIPLRVLNRPVRIVETGQQLILEMPANIPFRVSLFAILIMMGMLLLIDFSGGFILRALDSWTENGFPKLDISLATLLWLLFTGYVFYLFFRAAKDLLAGAKGFFWYIMGNQTLYLQKNDARIINRVWKWKKEVHVTVNRVQTVKEKNETLANEVERKIANWLNLTGLQLEHDNGEELIGISLSDSEVSIVEKLLQKRLN